MDKQNKVANKIWKRNADQKIHDKNTNQKIHEQTLVACISK